MHSSNNDEIEYKYREKNGRGGRKHWVAVQNNGNRHEQYNHHYNYDSKKNSYKKHNKNYSQSYHYKDKNNSYHNKKDKKEKNSQYSSSSSYSNENAEHYPYAISEIINGKYRVSLFNF